MKKTVVFDFDGVIHSYTSGWRGATEIPDPPVPGIAEAISKIREKYRVVVVSSRCSQYAGSKAVQRWLEKYGIVVDAISSTKPPAVCYIDDRALYFDGHPEMLLHRIDDFKVWYGNKSSENDYPDSGSYAAAYWDLIRSAEITSSKWSKEHPIVGVGELRVDWMIQDFVRVIKSLTYVADHERERVESLEKELSNYKNSLHNL